MAADIPGVAGRADAGADGAFRWEWLRDPAGAGGAARFDSQYWCANVGPSDRYVMSVVGSGRYRLATEQSGFSNLYLGGNWIKTGMNATRAPYITLIMYGIGRNGCLGEAVMKVSREQAALNRERIVDVAAKLFREHGYDGIGVSDLMKSAGLTHGGFYGHFASKEDLLAEACERALGNSVQRWRALVEKAPQQALAAITDAYVSAEHRDHPGRGCAVGALGADVARLAAAGRHALTQGARAQIEILAGLMPAADTDANAGAARRQAIASYAAMIGAVLLARAVDDPALSGEILDTVAASLRGDQH